MTTTTPQSPPPTRHQSPTRCRLCCLSWRPSLYVFCAHREIRRDLYELHEREGVLHAVGAGGQPELHAPPRLVRRQLLQHYHNNHMTTHRANRQPFSQPGIEGGQARVHDNAEAPPPPSRQQLISATLMPPSLTHSPACASGKSEMVVPERSTMRPFSKRRYGLMQAAPPTCHPQREGGREGTMASPSFLLVWGAGHHAIMVVVMMAGSGASYLPDIMNSSGYQSVASRSNTTSRGRCNGGHEDPASWGQQGDRQRQTRRRGHDAWDAWATAATSCHHHERVKRGGAWLKPADDPPVREEEGGSSRGTAGLQSGTVMASNPWSLCHSPLHEGTSHRQRRRKMKPCPRSVPVADRRWRRRRHPPPLTNPHQPDHPTRCAISSG